MSTLEGLMLAVGQSTPAPYGDILAQTTDTRRGQIGNETALLKLAELKQSQATEQEYMAAIQRDPELAKLIFGGGGSVIGSLGTAPGGPPGAPGGMPAPGPITQSPLGGGATQQIPASPDASRFAGVPPQSGGPIPAGTMGQVMPTVTPPQGGSVLGSLGPQGGMPGAPQGQMQALRNPALEMARTNPRVALMLQQQIQGQEEFQMKRYGDRLTMGTKIAEAVGREAQTATDQASWDQARNNVAQFDPRAAAAMPAVYTPEAKTAFVKRAVSVKDNAQLQLDTWKNQIEEQKLGVQLANAGYQGLGEGVTSILRGLTDAQVQEFGGRTSPKAVAYATEQEKERKLTQVKATEVQRGETERELRGEKTLSETMGTKATNLFDTKTLEPVDTRMKQKDYEALPAGQVRELSPQLTEQITNIRTSVPIISQLQGHIDKIYGPGGVLERMTPDERADLAAVPGRWAKQYAQKYPEVAEAQRFIDSNAGGLARALAGEKGAMAEGDVERAKAMLPNLTTTLKVWPPADIGIQSPDTRAVAMGSMNSIVDMINGRVRTIIGNEQFTHPKLHRYETAQEVQAAGGDPRTQPTLPAPERPIPPTVGLNPRLPPVPPTFGPGDPTQQLTPRPPAPAVTPPASSTGDAYRRLMKPPTPGRQSQAEPGRRGIELARASGMKVMDMVDVEQAMEETGKSRAEVLAAARDKGYTVYGSGASSALA